MCDINCIWLFNLLVAVVFIILQQQHNVVASTNEQQQLQQYKYVSPNDGISSYAAAAAANYLRRNSLPHHVGKREVKKEKRADFISYINDFNMQDETSIPEDIIDQQHLQEIIDKQQRGILQQQQQQKQQQKPQQKVEHKYVAESTSGTSVLNGNGDIIDVNLPSDDYTDSDSDADIILESQGSSESSDNKKTINNNINGSNKNKQNDSEENEMLSEEKNEMDDNSKKNYHQTNNKKKEMFKDRKTLKNKIYNKKNNEKKNQQIKYENNNDYTNQYSSYGGVEEKHYKYLQDDADADADDDEDIFELDEDDYDDGSAEYERFKSLHQQKQKEQKQLEEQKEQLAKQNILINERTYGTQQYSNDKMISNADNDNDSDKATHIMLDYTDDNNNNNKNKNLNDYEIFHKHLIEERQKLLLQQQQQQTQQSQAKQDAIGDIDNSENPDIIKTTVSSKNYQDENKNNFGNSFIPRKIKRHNGFVHLDDDKNSFASRRMQDEQQQQHEQQTQQLESQINTGGNHPDVVAKVSSQEEIFKKKYYDILKENSTSASEHHIQQQQQQHHHHIQPTGELSSKDFSFSAESSEKEPTHEVKRQTAFEKEKTLRRNNKRYGHKNHKKKYKDYLRYSQIMMMPETNSTPIPEKNSMNTTTKMAKDNHNKIVLSEDDVADLNLLKDKHIEKLKLEKIKTLIPPAPIFVLKAHEDKENNEDITELEKVEEPTTKAFYEGQINYFLETPDDDSERANEVRFITKGERMDTNDWYRKLSPVLRNGNKKMSSAAEERSGIGVGRSRAGYSPYNYNRPQNQRLHQHGKARSHHNHHQHHNQHQQHHHNRSGHHHQIVKHSHHNAYQRKMIPKRLTTTTTPMSPPSRKHLASRSGLAEMGHQITDIKDLDRYYAKWPHLARVQSQLHEEQMREQELENYPDYEYDNDDYLEDNDNKEDNLPPYIRKFNRRNKQLLDLLEGTIAPPTKSPQQLRWSGSKLQPGPRDSSVGSMSVRIDDDYLKEKRKRYHQRQRQIHDLFSQQRTSTTTYAPPHYPYVTTKINNDDDDDVDADAMTAQQLPHTENHLPDEDVSISLESNEQDNEFSSNIVKHDDATEDDANDDSKPEADFWEKEIETKSVNIADGNSQIRMEKLITTTPTATIAAAAGGLTIKKSAIHKLPSYPSIAGGYMNRPRSRSAQFAPSSGSEYRRAPTPYLNNFNNNNDNINNNNNNIFINAGGFVAYNKSPVISKQINGRYSANTPNDYNKEQQQSVLNTTSPDAAKMQSGSSINNHLNPPSASMSSSASATNSFIYHRVVDASPRILGAGFLAGRKQRLPFVAITDRRLETSKKSLTDHEKDFEQNHYPLP